MRKKEKSSARKFLERDAMLVVQIDCLLAEKEQWETMAGKITASMDTDKVKSSGSQSKMADAVAACVDAEEEILCAVDNLAAQRKQIRQVLSQVDNPTWYKLLHLHYIQGYTLDEVAERCNASYDWAKTNHGRALGAVQRILNEEDLSPCVT